MSGGIDTATFLVIVTAMGGALVTLSAFTYKRLLEITELKVRLAAYEQNAPELLVRIEQWMTALEDSYGNLPTFETESRLSPTKRSQKRRPPES